MVEAFGGFYVYVDDIRVCPYGREDSDFLGFEKRRNLNSGRHFWSHRRMFGGVFLQREKNPDLTEKAGREGFQQNGAYRGLVHIIQTLFVELADSYFGTKAKRPDKEDKKHERVRLDRDARQERERNEFIERFTLSKRLIDSVALEFQKQSEDLEKLLAEAEAGMAEVLLDGCYSALSGLRQIYHSMWVNMVTQFPISFSLEAEDVESIDRYLHRRAEIDLEAEQQLKQLAARLDRLAAKNEELSKRESRTRTAIENKREEITKTLAQKVNEVLAAEQLLANFIKTRPDTDLASIDAIADKAYPPNSELPNDGAIEEIIAKQTRYLQEESLPFYDRLKSQLNLLMEGDGGLMEAADLREEIRLQKERESHLLELAQLGLVMESADHDYRSMLSDADKAMDELDKVVPESSKHSLQNLRDALQHIDEQLQAFDPLVRRVRGRVTELSGEDIRQFIQTAFDKVRRPTVGFEYTPKFLEAMFPDVKRPVFLGAVHNLVMNAGYWASKAKGNGKIRFSMAASGFVVSDSGPGVQQRDHERIFDPGFSRRPAGRGLGLFIARSCFQAFGYDLELLPTPASGALSGANFLITRPQAVPHELD